MGATIRKIFDSLVPEPLKQRLRILKETRELEKLAKLECQADALLAVQKINLDAIFASAEIEADWKTAVTTLQSLDIPDGIGGINPGDGRAIFYLLRYFSLDPFWK